MITPSHTYRATYFAWRIAAEIRLEEAVKRAVDVIVSGILLIALTPLFFVVAVLIKATDRGAALYWQIRVGRDGHEFPFPKFRSMVVGADRVRGAIEDRNEHGAAGVTFKMKRDPRVTRIGRIIRKLSIDELPQLWCVFRGDMSLVGPRPPLPVEVARYTPADRRRLEVTPGLTCTWQVSGRADIPFSQQVRLDIDYIERRGLGMDVRLLAMTVPAVLLGRGAY